MQAMLRRRRNQYNPCTEATHVETCIVQSSAQTGNWLLHCTSVHSNKHSRDQLTSPRSSQRNRRAMLRQRVEPTANTLRTHERRPTTITDKLILRLSYYQRPSQPTGSNGETKLEGNTYCLLPTECSNHMPYTRTKAQPPPRLANAAIITPN